VFFFSFQNIQPQQSQVPTLFGVNDLLAQRREEVEHWAALGGRAEVVT
jgi:hypothetical protein